MILWQLTQHFRNIFATFSQHFRNIFPTFSQHVRNIFATFSRYLRDMFTTFSRHVRDIFITMTFLIPSSIWTFESSSKSRIPKSDWKIISKCFPISSRKCCIEMIVKFQQRNIVVSSAAKLSNHLGNIKNMRLAMTILISINSPFSITLKNSLI